MNDIEYKISGDSVIFNKAISSDPIYIVSFVAENIRNEKTGVHAKLAIWINQTVVAWSTDNIERDEFRVRISRSAFKQFKEPLDTKYPLELLKFDLDQFCSGLWGKFIETMMPEELEGGENINAPYILNPFVIEGGGSIIFAPPGRGKSYAGQTIAVCVDSGNNEVWPAIKQSRTLFINLERSKQSNKQRLGNINVSLSLPRNRKLLTLNARGRTLMEVFESARKAVKDYKVEFVVLDSISRTGFGDLNENRPVNATCDALSRLCPTWLALGHTPRADEDHVFGSLMFDAAADMMIKLSSKQDNMGSLGVMLEITKSNDTGRKNPHILAFDFQEQGLIAIRETEGREFPELKAGKKPSMAEDIEGFILECGEATAGEINDELGYNRQNVSSYLNNSPKYMVTKKVGRKVYYGLKSDMSP